MMPQCMFSRSVLGIALCIASLTLMAGAPSVSAADGRVVNKIRKGRLPNHYAEVVTEKQREEILKIREEYQPKIDALQTQLDALKKERDEKVSAVLTEEQKKKVEEAAAAAAKARAEKKAEKPADAAKAADPAKPAENPEKKAEK
jgi:membrane protein involved in colicin uptake